jgi:hypothetical protein
VSIASPFFVSRHPCSAVFAQAKSRYQGVAQSCTSTLAYLHEVFLLQRLVPRATLGVEKVQQLLQSRRVCLVPEVCAFAPDGDQVFVLQLLKVMRERGTRDRQFALNVAHHHPVGIR